jgi:hypothetical protein
MLVYEERRHDESIFQVRALERALKQSSEGQRLNKLICEKNDEGFLPKSVGVYMNAAEGLASEAEAALRKARKYTDAAGGRLTAAVAGTKWKHQTGSASKPKCPGCGCFDRAYAECVYAQPLSQYGPLISIRVCNESGYARRSCPRFQLNPSVESGLSLGVGIPLRTVMAIPLHEQTRSRISRLFNATAALVNRTQILAEKNSMIGVARQRALGIAIVSMARIVIAICTTARIESGIVLTDE